MNDNFSYIQIPKNISIYTFVIFIILFPLIENNINLILKETYMNSIVHQYFEFCVREQSGYKENFPIHMVIYLKIHFY